MKDDGRDVGVEFLDAGRPRARRGVRSWRAWLGVLAVVLVGGAIGVRVTRHDHAVQSPQPSSVSASSTAVAEPSTSLPAPRPVTVRRYPAHLLGETGAWELVGRGPGWLVRVDLAAGLVTSTIVPALSSSGPVSLVAAGPAVFIRPVDNVPGYLVPDGEPAQLLPAAFADGGPMFPGPAAGEVWVDGSQGARPTVVSRSLVGRPTGMTIRLPAGSSTLGAVPDGRGYLLVTTSDGVYDARLDRVWRITRGELAASGRAGWLVVECSRGQTCRTVLIRSDGVRRIVGAAPAGGALPYGGTLPYGAVSPDGRQAAIFVSGPTDSYALKVIDLATGRVRSVDVDAQPQEGALAWSPDGRLLFVVDQDGGLVVIASSIASGIGTRTRLPITLPALTQLAVRSGLGS